MTESIVEPPPVPALGPAWRIRPVQPRGADLGLVTGWMNEPHVAGGWHQAWPEERWATELAGQLAGGSSVPCLVFLHHEAVAYVEIYRPALVPLGSRYPAAAHDLGVHIAIGDPANTGRGLGSLLLHDLAEGLLDADPACERVVAEPDVGNVASVRAFGKAGFGQEALIDLPHKTAALLIRPRHTPGAAVPRLEVTHLREPDDVVGIGFGPANLALAVALDEHNRESGGEAVRASFVERQQRFGWHRDMLIDGATVQVSFLKDLVTMRNPTSEFSFVSYLHAKDRLADFVNHKSLFPSRTEYNDYLAWVADHFAGQVEYGAEVVGIQPVRRDGRISQVDVLTRATDQQGGLRTRRARNVVIATGLRPVLPPGTVESERVWHSDGMLSRLDAVSDRPMRRVVVVGAGQSAAEAVEYLHRRVVGAEVCAVFSRFGYSPADDSPFANTIFDPAAVDTFFAAPDEVKRLVLDYHRNTNYSVVDPELIEELYRRGYQEKVTGRRRLRMLNLSRVVSTMETDAGVRTVVESMATGTRTVLEADLVVFATGYREADAFGLLGELGGHCLRDERGRARMARDYRVQTAEGVDCGIYLQGPTEHTHGIGSGLLSLVAVRAGEIVQSIVDRSWPAAVGPVTAVVRNGSRMLSGQGAGSKSAGEGT